MMKAFLKYFMPLCMLVIAYSGVNALSFSGPEVSQPEYHFSKTAYVHFLSLTCTHPASYYFSNNTPDTGEHSKIYSEENEEENYRPAVARKSFVIDNPLSHFLVEKVRPLLLLSVTHISLCNTLHYSSRSKYILFRVFRI
jgi:hypothetical protein